MTPDRLRRIAEVLEASLELDENLRHQYLAALGRSDEDLRRRVEELLALAEEPADTTSPETPSGQVSQHEGGDMRHIGPYRTLEWLGMGGMGTVYLAERADEEFERRVAIKVIRMGFDVPEVRRRFLSERQILAAFDHPNIAKMYEGGTTDSGHPYLVMEYIEGVPIDRFCDEQRLTVRQRLELFRQVCSAVEYAHRNLVVHRDLKPSNVLVTPDGNPKLLDFGIAKLLDPEQFPITVEATETGRGPLTPNYASPEQIKGERITTVSDVYSLGVLLYKLLTGRLPFARATRSRDILIQQASSLEATKPSLVVGSPQPDEESGATTDSSLWSSDTGSHRRQLRGDLDNIVLMAIRGEADRRYGSVEQLAEDLTRHLEGLPVLARRASGFYRFSRFVRRHKLPVFATATVVLLTAGFLSVTLAQNQRISRQAENLLQAKETAEEQTQRAEEVAAFFVEMFVDLAPSDSKRRQLTAPELLERATERLFEDPSGDPAVRARLLTNLGRTFALYGDSTRGATLVERALEESQTVGGEALAEASLILAGIRVSVGRLEEGLELCEQSAELYESQGNIGGLIDALSDLGFIVKGPPFNDIDRAEASFDRAVALSRRIGDAAREAVALKRLAYPARSRGDLARAISVTEEALAIEQKAMSSDHLNLGETYNNLGFLYRMQGRLTEAKALIAKGLAVRLEALGSEAPRVAMSHNNLAWIRITTGEYTAAENHARKAIRIYLASAGPEHPTLIYPLNNLGSALMAQDKFREAIDSYEHSLDIAEGYSVDSSFVAWTGLGWAHLATGDDEQASTYFAKLQEASIPLIDEGRATSLRSAATAHLGLGILARRRGDEASAIELWTTALELASRSPEDGSVDLDRIHLRILCKLSLGVEDGLDDDIRQLEASGWRHAYLFDWFCAENNVEACEKLAVFSGPS